MQHLIVNSLVSILGVLIVGYHLIFSQTYLQGEAEHLIWHLCPAMALAYLVSIQKHGRFWLLKALAALCSLGLFLYLWLSYDRLELYGMYMANNWDLAAGILLILLCLEATRQQFGPVLPGLALVCIVYMFAGPYLPGMLRTPEMSWKIIVETLTVGFTGSGVFGTILNVSAMYIFLFMLFAALVDTCGANEFFNQLGKLIARRFRAGPALAAVMTSSLMGSVTGQVGANVTITGSYTIPAMKKVGYAPYQAGAIEAAASTGGPIMPPIMGVAAFMITAITGLPYSKVIAVATVPALFYLFSCALYVHFQAAKMDVVSEAEQVDYKELFFRSPLFLGSLAAIIVLFMMGKSALNVSFWACVTITFISYLRKATRPSFKGLIDGLVRGAALGASIAVTCGTLGIIVATITGTGLGIKLPALVGSLCGDNLLLLMVMTALVSFVLGIGLPASAAYLVVAIVLAPLLIRLGVSLLPAHLFAFYCANFSFLTPPVALAALFGAQIAGAPFMKTGIEAAKVGIAGFLLPFMVVWSPSFAGDFSRPEMVILDLLICLITFIAAQAALVGYFRSELKAVPRALLAALALGLMLYLYSRSIWWMVGCAALGALFLAWQFLGSRFNRPGAQAG